MSGSAAPIAWRHLFRIMRDYMPLWAGATVVFTGLGFGYTRVRVPKYAASQSLVVRNETVGDASKLGRFASQTDLKAAQETILELAHNSDVISEALTKLGPENGASEKTLTADGQPSLTWITQKVIDSSKKDIAIRPPKGSEFGATEVVYLETHAVTKDRAEKMCMYVRDCLAVALREVRAERVQSVIKELTHARDLARDQRDEASAKLKALESGVGSDLGELRALTESFAGSGNSQRVISEMQKELAQAELQLESLRELESVLKRGQQDPHQLMVSGGDLLNSQPTLRRLKDGFIDAQIEASRLSSRYTSNHPKMRAAEVALQEIQQKIQNEIAAAISSMQPQIRVAVDRVNNLNKRKAAISGRLDQLADMRSGYSNLLLEFKARSQLLEQAEAALNEAVASRQAATNTDLITPLGPIQVSENPIGPNDKMLLVASTAAGLIFGFGMVFLVAPGVNQDNFGRRWSDYSGNHLNHAAAEPPVVNPHQPVTTVQTMQSVQTMPGYVPQQPLPYQAAPVPQQPIAGQPYPAAPAQTMPAPAAGGQPQVPDPSALANASASAWDSLQRLARGVEQEQSAGDRVDRRRNPR